MDLAGGLSRQEAERRLRQFGFNELEKKSRVVWWWVLLRQLASPLIYVLLVAAGVTFWLDELIDTGVILVAVILNTILGFIQEFKAEKSLEALAEMISLKVKVKRDGEWKEMEAREVVPGDVIRLEIGGVVPADGILIREDGIFINEAILTGESVPVEKKEKAKINEEDLVKDFKQTTSEYKAFMGTVLERGIGELLVVKTGSQTQMGKIALGVKGLEMSKTPLQQKLFQLSQQLAIFVGVVALLVLVIGLAVGDKFVEIFPTAVALAVAAIPEGLLVSLTVILTIGMRRILKRKALVRKLLAAETLGGVDVICLDKTGTLTRGKMQAVGVVTSVGRAVSQQIGNIKYQNQKQLPWLIKAMVLCNDMRDPLEVAMYDWAMKHVQIAGGEKALTAYARLDELPFDLAYKYIVTRYKGKEKGVVEFISGAPEVVLGKCKLSGEEKDQWERQFSQLGTIGYRLVGFGYKIKRASKESKGDKIRRSQVKDYQWLGVCVFEDPVRQGVAHSLKKARQAGIDIKVITGDYKETAWSVVRQINLVEGDLDPKKVMLGEDLAKLVGTDNGLREDRKDELAQRLEEVVLFARTTPDQKLLIVKTLQERGHILAMTGDGVNDAPALKQADIGIVLNEASDVSRQVADMVLLDNNFKTILAAVEEGRGIFENLRKVLLYLLADAFAEVILVVGSLILGWPLPLLAVQILWINLVSDGFPYLALTVEPKDKDLLEQKPRAASDKIMDWEIGLIVVLISLTAGLMTLGAFGWYYFVLDRGLEVSRNMAFAMLAVNSLVYVFSSRSLSKPIWKAGLLKNPWLIAGVVGGFVMQLSVMYLPGLQNIFRTNSLNLNEWGLVLGSALILIVIIEGVKWSYLHKVFK